MKKHILSGAFALSLALTSGLLQAGTVGTTTADILKINNGARPAGMGGAYTALGDDSYSIDYNPAGLAGIKVPQLVLMHSDHLANINYEYFVFAAPWGANRDLALHLNYRHTPPIDNNNNLPPVTTSDMVAALTATQRFTNLNLGLTLKYIHSSLDVVSASAYAVDLGATYSGLPYNLKAGLSIQNLGTSMKFIEQSDPLPMFIRFGVAWTTLIKGTRRFNAAVDVFKPSDQPLKMAVGAECWLFEKLFAVRAGVKREGISKNPGNLFQNYSLGFTLTRPIGSSDLSVDFAYDPAAYDLTTEDTYFVALKLDFNTLKVF